MIALRARQSPSDDWEMIQFDGEREEEIFDILASALTIRDFRLQAMEEGQREWEDL